MKIHPIDLVLLIGALLGGGFVAGALYGHYEKHNEMEERLADRSAEHLIDLRDMGVECGCGGYNPKTGEYEWNTGGPR